MIRNLTSCSCSHRAPHSLIAIPPITTCQVRPSITGSRPQKGLQFVQQQHAMRALSRPGQTQQSSQSIVCSAATASVVAGSNPWNIIFVVAGIVALLLGIFWQNVQRAVVWGQRQAFPQLSMEEDVDAVDDKTYRVALARTRQSLLVSKAVIFMNAGNPARAVVELKRALQENAICREGLLNARVEKEDLLGLYRVHLLNSELPLEFGTLLQLREMFDLGNEEAEKLEQEVMENPALFSI